MKTLRHIFMAAVAILLVATCDDDSMNIEKTYMEGDCSYNLRVDFGETDSSFVYCPRWNEPEFKITHGEALMMGGLGMEYEVYVWNCKSDSKPILLNSIIKKDESNESNGEYFTLVGLDEVYSALGTSENFLFGVKAAKMPGGNDTSNIEFQKKYEVCIVVDNNKETGIGGSVELESPSPTKRYSDSSPEKLKIDAYIWEFSTKVDGVTLTAKANPGYKFDHWSDGKTENPRELTVSGNVFWEAVFVPFEEEFEDGYTVSVRVGPSGGCGTVAGADKYKENAAVTLTANPNNGYTFAGWFLPDGSPVTDDNGKVITNQTYSFNVKNSVDLVAYFDYELPHGFGSYDYNEWIAITLFDESNAWFEKGVLNVSINNECQTAWDYKIANVFTGLEGQALDSTFQLKFKVTWTGEDSAAFRILPNLDDAYEQIGNNPDINTSSSEILDVNLYDFRYAKKGEWRDIDWGGKIGPQGNFIGIGIDLGGYGIDDFIPNGTGTFQFKEIKVLINGKERIIY